MQRGRPRAWEDSKLFPFEPSFDIHNRAMKKLHDRDPTALPPNVFLRWRLISTHVGLHFQWIHWDNDHGMDGEFDPIGIDFKTMPTTRSTGGGAIAGL